MENKDNIAGVEFNPPAPNPRDALQEKLAAAQVAMAGPERVAKHEEDLKRETAKKQKLETEKRLAEINKQKEKFEVDWITLDDKRKEINLNLTPILTDEKTLEEEEAKVELEEARATAPGDKQLAENKRWAAQTKRHQLEEKKWTLQESLKQAEDKIAALTTQYQTLLDEEDKLKQQLIALEPLLG